MSTEFLLGILVAIPVGILANIITPSVQRYLDRRSKNLALKQTKNMQAEYEQILEYKSNPTTFSHYLLITVLRTTYIGSLLAIIAGLVYIVGNGLNGVAIANSDLSRKLDFVGIALYLIGQLINVVGAILIVNTCRTAFNAWYRIQNFANYEKTVKAQLQE